MRTCADCFRSEDSDLTCAECIMLGEDKPSKLTDRQLARNRALTCKRIAKMMTDPERAAVWNDKAAQLFKDAWS